VLHGSSPGFANVEEVHDGCTAINRYHYQKGREPERATVKKRGPKSAARFP
jgi:hypothetical protein